MKGSFIAKIAEVAAKGRANPYWEMILAIAPSIVEERVVALSAVRPDLLRLLWKSLQGLEGENWFINYALSALKRVLPPAKVDVAPKSTAEPGRLDYRYYFENLSSVDSYQLATVIDGSLKENISIESWREAFLPLITPDRDPRELIPAIYKLINPEWNLLHSK